MPIPNQLTTVVFQIEGCASLINTLRQAVTALLPRATFGSGRVLSVQAEYRPEGLYTEVNLHGSSLHWKYLDTEISAARYDTQDRQRRVKERVRLGVQHVLSKEYQIPFSPWGILTGVRPTKMVNTLLDRGLDQKTLDYLLTDVYAIRSDRQQLVLTVAKKQRRYFHVNPNRPVSIYVGIPFCPTRCGYCSFASYPLSSHGHLMPRFFQALCIEIEELGILLQELQIPVETVYLGGGTPTTIRGKQLQELMDLLNQFLSANRCQEFMVEAGRPETLDEQQIAILAEAGVSRISINPQTMQDKTLQAIGRCHTSEQVKRAFSISRKAKIPMINSDIILGLPGETSADVEDTLAQLCDLAPDSLTVHSLAMKRAAYWRKEIETLEVQQSEGELMAAISQQYAQKMGMDPYYLYRQRFILSDLENIGYAKPGAESIYNIQMMEERQTVIGLGGGAITKLVSPDLRVSRLSNPKCPATYEQQLGDTLAVKKTQIRQHLSV